MRYVESGARRSAIHGGAGEQSVAGERGPGLLFEDPEPH
jgi:hypothetical protein